jgi:hypothetical protein
VRFVMLILIPPIVTGVLGALYLVGLTVYIVSSFLQVGQTLDPTLTSLGLTAEGYMGFGRRYYGELNGRRVDITYQPPQAIRSALLNVTVDADVGTRAAMVPRRPLLDCTDCPAVDVEIAELGHLLIVAQDEAWLQHLLAEPANAAVLLRLLGDQETPGTSELYFQLERVWLRAHPQQLAEAQLRRLLDDVISLAEAAEANAP